MKCIRREFINYNNFQSIVTNGLSIDLCSFAAIGFFSVRSCPYMDMQIFNVLLSASQDRKIKKFQEFWEVLASFDFLAFRRCLTTTEKPSITKTKVFEKFITKSVLTFHIILKLHSSPLSL